MGRINFDLDIVPYLSNVVDHGKYISASCVFHYPDAHPSMLVWKDGYYKCLSCNAHGTLSKLLSNLSGMPVHSTERNINKSTLFTDSRAEDLLSFILECYHFLINNLDPLALYLVSRGIGNQIVPRNLGWCDGWYTIPITEADGYVKGVVARASQHIQDTTGARFNIPQGQQAMVYVPDHALVERNDYIVVVYGMFDALSLCELGIPSCTPTSGKDSLHAEDLDTYRKRVIIIPDKGEESTAIKLRDSLGWRGTMLDLPYPDGCKDPNDLLVKGYGEWLKDEIRKEIE